MKKTNLFFVSLFSILITTNFTEGRLSSNVLVWVTGQLDVAQQTYNTQLSALTNDCDRLKFKLLNKIALGQIVTKAILGYVIETDFITTNLDNCDLGFRPEDSTSFAYNATALLPSSNSNGAPYKVNISGLQLVNGSSTSARFEHACLNRVRFDGSDLTGASFEHSIVIVSSFISFIGTNLTNSNISHVHWHNAIFKDANLTGSDLSHSTFRVVDFSGADLTNTNFQRARIHVAVCDPNNMPTVSNVTLSDGSITSSATTFCASFDHSHRIANV